MQYDVTATLKRNERAVGIVKKYLGWLAKSIRNTKPELYTPKNDAFIIVGNHCDIFDPAFEIISLDRYIRFVASDHLIHLPVFGKLMLFVGGVIVKYRDRPSDELIEEIKANINAGIPVGIHAEGGTTFNGETGYVSENTGKLVKESGAALITYRFTGGYLKAPRWSNKPRSGKIYASVVAEYSPEELSRLTAEEITDIIRRDIYVNAFEEQRKNPQSFKGKSLAESLERVLYVCPHCKQVGTLQSHGDELSCQCGYKLTYGEDGFFHPLSGEMVFDNVLDWDKWQREQWKGILLSAKAGEELCRDSGQTVYSVNRGKRTLLAENADLVLYPDSIKAIKDGREIFSVEHSSAKKVQTAMKDFLIVVGDSGYYDINSQKPRSATKYEAAWRYLTGREYV